MPLVQRLDGQQVLAGIELPDGQIEPDVAAAIASEPVDANVLPPFPCAGAWV